MIVAWVSQSRCAGRHYSRNLRHMSGHGTQKFAWFNLLAGWSAEKMALEHVICPPLSWTMLRCREPPGLSALALEVMDTAKDILLNLCSESGVALLIGCCKGAQLHLLRPGYRGRQSRSELVSLGTYHSFFQGYSCQDPSQSPQQWNVIS